MPQARADPSQAQMLTTSPVGGDRRLALNLPSAGRFELQGQIQLPLVGDSVLSRRLPVPVVRSRGSLSFVRNGVQEESIDIGSDQNLLNYDALAVTYRSIGSDKPCMLSGQFAGRGELVEGGASRRIEFRLFSRSEQLSRSEVLLGGAKVVPRQADYFFQRHTGRHLSTNWHRSDVPGGHVYKRLFDVNLKRVEYIDLVLAPEIERVNFRLSREKSRRPTEVIEWDALRKTWLNDGEQKRVRLDVGAVLDRHPASGQDAEPLSLVEVIAFASPRKVLAPEIPPVGELVVAYRSAQSYHEGPTVVAPAEVARIGPGIWQWSMPLSALREKHFRRAEWTGGTIQPANPSCAVDVDRVELVSLVPTKRPVWLARVNDQVRAWGGPFTQVIDAETRDVTEWPKVVSRLRPGLFSGNFPRSGEGPGAARAWEAMGLMVRPSASVYPALTGAGLEIHGKGDLELVWRSGARVPEHAFLFVGADEFGLDKRLPVVVELRFDDRKVHRVVLAAGGTVDLAAHSGRMLESVSLRTSLGPSGSAWILHELALFSVTAVAPAQSFHLPVPSSQWIVGNSAKWVSHAQGASSTLSLAHNTGIRKTDLDALRVEYALPAPPAKPCWLVVELEGPRHRAMTTLCPLKLKGVTSLGMRSEALAAFPDDEEVTKVHWRTVEDALPAGTEVNLTTSYLPLNAPSLSARLAEQLKVQIGSHVSMPLPSNEFWTQLVHGRAWLNYPAFEWSGGRIDIGPVALDPTMFEVKGWRFQRQNDVVTFNRWTERPTHALGGFRPYLMFVLSLLILALLAQLWRRGAIHQWANSVLRSSLRLLGLGGEVTFRGGKALKTFLLEQRLTLNVLITVAAWGMWYRCLSVCEPSHALDLALPSLVLLTLLAGLNGWRWRTQGREPAAGRVVRLWLLGAKWPPLGLWLLTMAAAIVVISSSGEMELGTGDWMVDVGMLDSIIVMVSSLTAGFVVESLWRASWPIWAALAYGLLPWVLLLLYGLTTRRSRPLRWIIFGILVFLLGFGKGASIGESLYSAFGAIVVVIAWKVSMNCYRTDLVRKWPRIDRWVYAGAGSVYFAGAILGLVFVALFSVLNAEPLAQQIAMSVYFFIFIGIVFEILIAITKRTDAKFQKIRS
jgi:hypothetical protein